MPTNVFFNPFPANYVTSEQNLVEDLVIEALKIYGMDVYYMPRSASTEASDIDYLYGEHSLKKYTHAYPIEMYLENVTGMDGEGDFISKFGLEIRDEVSMLVSRRQFRSTVPQSSPSEGDLIYMPLTNNFFEISFVEHENDQAMFHTLGRGRGGNVYVYALKLKKFVFSNELIQTGIDVIDKDIRSNYARTRIALDDVEGKFLNDEIVYQGDSLETATARALVYDFFPNSHIDVYRVEGEFTSSIPLGSYNLEGRLYDNPLKGETSGATAFLSLSDDTFHFDNAFEDIKDNNRIQRESDEILDWSERNPFGET